jgi:8-oxo-dGTP diphosphatase
MERSVAGIILREGRVFIALRGPKGSFSGCWEFPGGKVEAGESDEAALAREFDEEFGLRVVAKELLGETLFPHRGKDRVLAAWLLEAPSFERLELVEHDDTKWAGAAELERLTLVDSDRRILEHVLPLLKP